MKTSTRHSIARTLDIGYEEFLPFFDGFSEGLLIVDRFATIIYYNAIMAAIDELDPAQVLGKKVVDVYELSETDSVIMQCLKNQQPIVDRSLLYRTRRGKVANTIHTVFPLFKHDRLEGAICLVREYNVLEETISSVSIPRNKRVLPNDTRFDFEDIIGRNIDFLRAVNTAKMAANTPSPVMLYGETGTGKELFAQAIHNQSGRMKRRYTAVNCAAIPENLLEGLLFGTTSGAFTGARNKLGLFERASGGTLFLDELNSMGTGLQAKILRVIQERKVRRLGSLRETEIDVKIISSVNKEPHVAIAENNLRPDLFYRLGVVFIPIPPLRDRKEDIVLLARHFLAKHSRVLKRQVADISASVLALFNEYDWPGNVRELEHVIEGAINLVVSSRTIERRHLQSHLTTWRRLRGLPNTVQPPVAGSSSEGTGLHGHPRPHPRGYAASAGADRQPVNGGKGLLATQADLEKVAVTDALAAHGGNVTRAAASIGISRQLFTYKMKKYRIDRRDYLR
ncbi:arginine utilization regulatory protein RocR [Desulfosarcina alkanivorans]|uniref:Arginine utilization regulatory protein RocR n=1 Tax=Desulfosarcina alkanivorans TaxID=571177 RepID=A0A5K7YT56_9BACT|nr:sigma 54-interacting transcriptional regulator [Desulfosarcina alkanivorans]BBO71818.1 arginine utilization regulatory protein RocR [Desulfosarcina alkanivorans]